MTKQISEILYVDGHERELFSRPLDALLEKMPSQPNFGLPTTACHRGYVGHWAIIENCLYLRRLDAYHPNWKKCLLPLVFPNVPHPVFADWYSGTLRVPIGERQNSSSEYFDVFEDEMRIRVRNGVVTKAFFMNDTLLGRYIQKLKIRVTT